MPAVGVFGMIAGAAAAEAILGAGATVFGGMMAASTLGGVLGSGLASGIYAQSQGGSFGSGFMSGALGAGVGYALGGIFSDTPMSETAFQAADAQQLMAQGLSPSAIGQNMAAAAGDMSAVNIQSLGMNEIMDYGGTNAFDAGNVPTLSDTVPTGPLQQQPSVQTGLGDMYQSTVSPVGSATNLSSYQEPSILGYDKVNPSSPTQLPEVNVVGSRWTPPPESNGYGLGHGGESPYPFEGINETPTTPATTPTATTTGTDWGKIGSDAWGNFKAGIKEQFAPQGGQSMQRMGMALGGGLYDMYSAQQMQDEYKKNAQAYQQQMNNPEIGYRNWMQGQGGEALKQAQAKAARSGHTNMAPALQTATLRDWYSQGYKPYMEMQGNLTDQRNAIANIGNYARTAPTRNLYTAMYTKQPQVGKP